jgi:uncharacterized protein (DUF983 family)
MRLLRAVFDGLIHRCPRCHRGHMFKTWFTMHRTCPNCELEFERASGEVSGGMAINFVFTIVVLIACSLFALSPTVPLALLMGGLVLYALLFPILFYPSSRGIWAGFLYITGDNTEGDSHKQRPL